MRVLLFIPGSCLGREREHRRRHVLDHKTRAQPGMPSMSFLPALRYDKNQHKLPIQQALHRGAEALPQA